MGSYFGGWLWTLLLTLPHSLAVNLAYPAIAVNDNVYGCARLSSAPASRSRRTDTVFFFA